MKKKYVKPTIFIENFELNQHIAACAPDVKVTVNSPNKYSCAADLTQKGPDGDFTLPNVFNESPCVIIDEDYCYTTGKGDSFVFNS